MIIEVHDLVKRYDKLLALNHLSFEVKTGEVLGLLGPNGCGKSTAINCLLSLLSYEKGQIKLFGQEMTPTRYDLKKRIGIVPQDVAVFEELTVWQNIDYYCGLYIEQKKRRQQYVEEAIELVGLDDFRHFLPKKLSGGLKRRLNIACGIAHKPELIFLDEPTVAVDPQSRNKILANIQNLNQQGATIIYTSHYMEEVEQLCDRIVIMDHGQVIAKGTKEELKEMIQSNERIAIELPEFPLAAQQALLALPAVLDLTYENGQAIVTTQKQATIFKEIFTVLEQHELIVGSFFNQQPTLNDVFLEITGRQLRDH